MSVKSSGIGKAFEIVIISGLAVLSCGPAMAASKLSRIFQNNMLTVEVTYLEKITGPAKYVSQGRGGIEYRSYEIEGCKVKAHVEGTQVRRYELALTPKCNFNPGAFLSGYASTKGLTVGKFLDNPRKPIMRFHADCLYSCGNAADPDVDFIWNGPHSDNFLSIRLSVVLVSNAALAASQAIEKTMLKNEDENYLLDTKFNCDEKYDEVAVREFAKVPVTGIVIGYEKVTDRCDAQ